MFRCLILTALALLICSTPVYAHRMKLSCTLETERIRIDVFYDDGEPAQEATVKIGLDEQNVIFTGTTDTQGICFVPRPEAGTYRVWAASVGHRASETLTVPAKSNLNQPSEKLSQSPANQPKKPATREEQTQTPYLELAVGLGIISLLALLFWKRRSKSGSRDSEHRVRRHAAR